MEALELELAAEEVVTQRLADLALTLQWVREPCKPWRKRRKDSYKSKYQDSGQ